MKWTLFLLIPLLLGCNAQKKLNRKIDRAEKYAKKHNLTTIDTVTVEYTIHDTIEVITERISVDTVFSLSKVHDTLIIELDKLRIRFYYDTITQKVYLDGEVKVDTIYQPYEKTIYVDVPCEKISHITKENNTFWLWVVIIVQLLIISWFIKGRFRR